MTLSAASEDIVTRPSVRFSWSSRTSPAALKILRRRFGWASHRFDAEWTEETGRAATGSPKTTAPSSSTKLSATNSRATARNGSYPFSGELRPRKS